MPWQEYLRPDEQRRDWEPRDPAGWLKVDQLSDVLREYRVSSDIGSFEDRVGWTFAAWTRLEYRDRISALLERSIVANLLREGTHKQFSDLVAVGVQSDDFYGYPLPMLRRFWRRRFDDYVAVVNVSTPTAAEVVGELRLEPDAFMKAVGLIDRPSGLGLSVPIVVQHTSAPVEHSQAAQPVQTSGTGTPPPLHCSDVVYGATAAGLTRPGLVTAFVQDATSSDPRLLGSAHVLGNAGNTVTASGKGIGRVKGADASLDAAVVELDSPWAVDYRVRTLGIIPAAPLLPTLSMNVQYVDQTGFVQTGYIWQTNLVAPGQATVGLTPNFTVSCGSKHGDSGGLIMTGHHASSALQHYARATSAGVLDMYRAAMLGHVLGGAQGGPAAVPSQTWGIPIVEVLASLGVEPIHR